LVQALPQDLRTWGAVALAAQVTTGSLDAFNPDAEVKKGIVWR
jgi:hypothetical protein